MGLWSWLFGGGKRKPRSGGKSGKAGRDMPESMRHSLVLLLREPQYLDQPILCNAVERTFGADLAGADEEDNEFARMDGPVGFVQVGDYSCLVNNFDVGYFGESDPDEMMPELRLRQAIKDHSAWMSVDMMLDSGKHGESQKLAFVGKLLAALAPEDALALVRPFTGQIVMYTPAVAESLENGDGADAFLAGDRPVPISGVEADDPRMRAAVQEARDRFGEFENALKRKRDGQSFAIKAPFMDDDVGPEFMWVEVSKVDATHITGRLGNEPAFVKSVRYQQLVRIPREKLNDWLITDGDEVTGGFTIKILTDQLEKQKEE